MKQIKDHDLLPCPFCGGKAKVEADYIYGEAHIFCSNEDCLIQPERYLTANRKVKSDGSLGGYDFETAKQVLIEMWNERVYENRNKIQRRG